MFPSLGKSSTVCSQSPLCTRIVPSPVVFLNHRFLFLSTQFGSSAGCAEVLEAVPCCPFIPCRFWISPQLERNLWADLKLGMSLRLPKPDLSSGKSRGYSPSVCVPRSTGIVGMILQAPEQNPRAADPTAPSITLVHTAPAGHTTLACHQRWEEAAFWLHNHLLRGLGHLEAESRPSPGPWSV